MSAFAIRESNNQKKTPLYLSRCDWHWHAVFQGHEYTEFLKQEIYTSAAIQKSLLK